MIDSCLIVTGNGWVRSRCIPNADVALGAAVKQSLVADLLVNPCEPRVFVDGRLPANRYRILIIQRTWSSGTALPLERPIGNDEAWRAAIDRTDRRTPWKRSHDLAHRGPDAKALRLIQDVFLIRLGGLGQGWRQFGKIGAANSGGHNHLLPVELQLTDSFVVDEEECLVLHDWPAERHPILAHAEWGNCGVAV